MKRTLLPISLSAVAAAIFLLWPETSTVPPTPDTPTTSEQTAPPAATPLPPAGNSVANPTPAVQDKMVDGKTLSMQGDTLLPTPTVIELFNAWLADTQSKRYEDWKPGAMEKAAALPAAAREQLGRWLDQYVELNLALQLMSVQGEPTWDNILSNVRGARSAYFAENEMALFSSQVTLEDFTEKAVTAFGDDNNPLATLVDLQSEAQQLPPAVREKIDPMLSQLSKALQQDSNLQTNTQAWQTLVQANAAATLETPSVDLTEANADFLKRYNVYSEAREGLLQQGATEEQLRVLRESHFSGAELLRAGTFDKALAE